MLEGIVLGIIQGVTEWLPISSEAAVILVKTNFFQGGESLSGLIEFALFLHLGTFLAAGWYLRDDVIGLLKMVFKPHRIFQEGEMERMFRFLAVATLVSGLIGYGLLQVVLASIEEQLAVSAKIVTVLVGVLLLGTAFLQFAALRRAQAVRGSEEPSGFRRGKQKGVGELQGGDSVLLGAIQGLSALPGLSRSGLTISALLLRNYNDTTALRVSFLMSLPVVLGGNIVLNIQEGIALSPSLLFGFLFAFLSGILTIHLLFRFARKLNFAYFVFLFGMLTIVSAFL